MNARVPSVSVVIPTYQRQGFVTRAIASVRAQTQSDFELIVIDDGSTDGTGAALAPMGDAIRYRWQPNRGVAAARNAGIRLARAPLVAFLDSDDWWLPDHLAVVTEMLRLHPEAVVASTSRGHLAVGRQEPEEAELVDALPEVLVTNDVGFVSGMAARRDALLAAGGFDERLSVAEDSQLWVRLAIRGPFAFLRRRTVVRRTTRGGLSDRGGRSGAYLEAWELGWPPLISELEQRESDDRAGLIARAKADYHLVRGMRALGRREDSLARVEFERACGLVPELSTRPLGVSHRVDQLPDLDRPTERLRAYRSVAALWPDQRADTALYLRARAVLLALRSGRAATAAHLVRGWPMKATPGFVVRTLPVLGRILNWRIRGYRHRGRESPLLQGETVRRTRLSLRSQSLARGPNSD
jgi:hypothetical protein